MTQTPTQRFLNHRFHVNLSDMLEGEEYWLQVADAEIPLALHTTETLREAHAHPPLLKALPEGELLTHFTAQPVPLPLGCVIRISVRHSNRTGTVPGDFGVHFVAMQAVPDDEHHRLLASGSGLKIAAEPVNYLSTAKALILHHPDLMALDPALSAVVDEHMDPELAPDAYQLLQNLAKDMRRAGVPSLEKDKGWANYVPFAVEDDLQPHYQTLPTDATIAKAGPLMAAVQISTKNDLRLQGKTWTQEQGVSTETDPTTLRVVGQPELLAELVADANAKDWNAKVGNGHKANGLVTSVTVLDSPRRKVRLRMENTYIRWLGAYIQFFDAGGNAMDASKWKPDNSGLVVDAVNEIGLNYDSIRFVGLIDPIGTFMGFPLADQYGLLEVDMTFPAGAVSARIYGCGLGTGDNSYPSTPVVGGVLTGLTNLGIPSFMIGFGVAGQSYKKLYDLMQDPVLIAKIIAAGSVYFGAKFAAEGVNGRMNWKALTQISEILFTKAANKLLIWCYEQIATQTLKNQIPFAGWIMVAVNVAASLAQMTQTIVHVATSPWMIANSLSTTITSLLTIHPDPRNQSFPRPPQGVQPSYVTRMRYLDQNRPTVTSAGVPLNADRYPRNLTAAFENTLGGRVKFEVDFYLGSWLAGRAVSDWMDNNAETAAEVTLYLFQQPIPLDEKSVYRHRSILTYRNERYSWKSQDAPPTGTLADTNASQSGNAISGWTGLALSQRSGMIGLSWKAAGMGIADSATGAVGQLHAFQNINQPGTPMEAVKFPDSGFSAPSQLIYDVFPARFLMRNGSFILDKDGRPQPDPSAHSLGNYYIDPRKAARSETEDGGYHLRRVRLDPRSPFDMQANQKSFGRFPHFPDSMALHPNGFAVGVNRQYNKLMIAPLAADAGRDDGNIPMARAFAGKALDYNGSGGREGLLFTPIAISCSYAGTILILEQIQTQDVRVARIQAFDLQGNPVPCFKGANGAGTAILTLPADVTYLDLAAVGDAHTTYLYVLYYAGSGNRVEQYAMGLYTYGESAPDGHLLVTTPNIPAAKLNVDMWHTLYTLNYQMTQGPDGRPSGPAGGPGTGPAGRTVPSVSEWLPPLPH